MRACACMCVCVCVCLYAHLHYNLTRPVCAFQFQALAESYAPVVDCPASERQVSWYLHATRVFGFVSISTLWLIEYFSSRLNRFKDHGWIGPHTLHIALRSTSNEQFISFLQFVCFVPFEQFKTMDKMGFLERYFFWISRAAFDTLE